MAGSDGTTTCREEIVELKRLEKKARASGDYEHADVLAEIIIAAEHGVALQVLADCDATVLESGRYA